MFLRNTSDTGYGRYGDQKASGPFLMLFTRGNETRDIRCAVRHVKMREFGNFMMGRPLD